MPKSTKRRRANSAYNQRVYKTRDKVRPTKRTVTIPGYLDEPFDPVGSPGDTSNCVDRRYKPNPAEPAPDFSVLQRRYEPHVLHTEPGPRTTLRRIEGDGEPAVIEHDMTGKRPYRPAGSQAYRTMGNNESRWVNYDAARKTSRYYRPMDE